MVYLTTADKVLGAAAGLCYIWYIVKPLLQVGVTALVPFTCTPLRRKTPSCLLMQGKVCAMQSTKLCCMSALSWTSRVGWGSIKYAKMCLPPERCNQHCPRQLIAFKTWWCMSEAIDAASFSQGLSVMQCTVLNVYSWKPCLSLTFDWHPQTFHFTAPVFLCGRYESSLYWSSWWTWFVVLKLKIHGVLRT